MYTQGNIQIRNILYRVILGTMVLFLGFGASSSHPANAQGEAAPNQRAVSSIVIDFDSIVSVPEYLREPVRQAAAFRISILPSDTLFYSTAFRLSGEGDWARIVLVPSLVIESGWESLTVDDIIEILAQRQSTGAWAIHFYKDEDFSSFAQNTPLDFIDFAQEADALSVNEYRFPWTAGESWWKNGGWHTGYYGLPNNAVDFQPKSMTSSANLTVLAADQGILDSVCGPDNKGQMWLKITNSDGTSGYGHLDGNTVRKDLLGKSVVLGQYLGNLYNIGGSFNTPCGQGDATHLHFVFPNRNITMYDNESKRDIPAEEIGNDTGVGNVSYTSNNIRVDNPFVKTSPANNATNQPLNPTLVWTEFAGAEKYQYCFDISNDNKCNLLGSWADNDNLSTDKTIGPLTIGTTYYWQIRALKNSTWTEADNKTWWSFKVATPPGAFSKNPTANVPSTQPVMLSWGASSGVIRYEYCYDTSNNNACDAPASWTSTDTSTTMTLPSGLAPSIYYWQVRAVNKLGVAYATYADNGTWQSFTILPGSFSKTSPSSGHPDQPKRPTLQWRASQGATSYEYCISTTTNCSGSTAPFTWTSSSSTSITISSDLAIGTTYYWQVRAISSVVPGNYTYANNDTWWSFTVPPIPGTFAKSSPANGATNVQPVAVGGTSYLLNWNPSSNATHYEYCIDTINDNGCNTSWTLTTLASPSGAVQPCTAITCVVVQNLSLGITYYWQVRAINSVGTIYADGGSWWSFTTLTPPPGAFNKVSPMNGITLLGSQGKMDIILAWNASSSATSYEYCMTKSSYCSTWTNTGTSTSITITLVQVQMPGTAVNVNGIYYWQVRAKNSGGITYANNSSTALWTFRVAMQ